MDFLLWALAFSIGFNLLLFIPAHLFKTDTLTDASYALTFIALAVLGYTQSGRTAAQAIAATVVVVWALRLGGFLFYRVRKFKKDSRFDGMRESFWRFLRFWILQGATVYIVLVAGLLLWRGPGSGLAVLSWAGLAVFGAGLVLESIADWQKLQFRRRANGKWINSGVWRYSRHPNYLGEIMVWTGFYLFCVPSLEGSDVLWGAASPIYITLLLLFVSGVPLLEKSADKKWGHMPEYQKYKANTPLLVPKIRF